MAKVGLLMTVDNEPNPHRFEHSKREDELRLVLSYKSPTTVDKEPLKNTCLRSNSRLRTIS